MANWKKVQARACVGPTAGRPSSRATAWTGVLFAMAAVAGCKSTYWSLMEQIGFEKREILVDRVEDARDAQAEAKEQFESALDRFRSVVDVEAGELEDTYDELHRSERMLEETRRRYEEVLAAMRRAEKSMEPVLSAFRDQVLVLKHNLDARAIGGLKNELDSIERDVAKLVVEMEVSIAEATAFIETMS